MSLRPRPSRGTSVIAALVFAALLGAIALGLNAWESNSTNPSALPAAVAADGGVQVASANPNSVNSSSSQTPTIPKCSQINDSPVSVTDSTKQACVCSYVNNDLTSYHQLSYSVYITNGKTETTRSVVQTTSVPQNTKCNVSNCGYGGCSAPTTGASPFADSSTAALSPDTSFPQECAQYGYNSQQCQTALAANTAQYAGNSTVSGVNLPSNCNSNTSGGAFTCVNSTQDQANTLQDTFQEQNGDSSYTCNYDGTSRTTTCAMDAQQPPPNTCLNGATNCTTTAVPPPGGGSQQQVQTCPSGMTCTPTVQSSNSSGLGSLGSLATGLATGLIRGLLSPCSAGYNPYQNNPYVGGNGTTLTPVTTYNALGQPVTTYVQQQQQPLLTTAPIGGVSPCGTTAAQAPYGVGSNGVACSVPPTQPQCSTGATAMPIYGSGNGCVTSYQCVPNNSSTFSQTPTPQLSCSPQIADVNESVAISYSCTNATGSSGSGFSTGNQASGSATAVIQAPPSGTNTATYGLTCTNSGQTASASCNVQINQPAIDLVADPQSVRSGATASIGWVTAGMQSCVISSQQDQAFAQANATAQNVNGVAQTSAITQSMEYDLTCATLGGQTKTASTIVTVSATSTGS